MIPFVDMHCHLVAGADDGPRRLDDAVAMCRILQEEGVGAVHALAHQNESYPDVTPDLIRAGIRALAERLKEERIPVFVIPGAEIMATPTLEQDWERGSLLSIGDRGQYVLIEMPHGLYVDLRESVWRLSQHGLRVVLAHPEQSPELLHGEGRLEQLIDLGCVTCVSAANVVQMQSPADLRRLKDWFRRGLVHVMGSDGHSPHRRPPFMAAACRTAASWIGEAAADRVCALNGMAILQGLPLKLPAPRPKGALSWLPRFWTSN